MTCKRFVGYGTHEQPLETLVDQVSCRSLTVPGVLEQRPLQRHSAFLLGLSLQAQLNAFAGGDTPRRRGRALPIRGKGPGAGEALRPQPTTCTRIATESCLHKTAEGEGLALFLLSWSGISYSLGVRGLVRSVE